MQRPMRDLTWPQQPASSARVVQWQRPVQHVSCTVFACQLFDLFTTPSLVQRFQPHLTYHCRQYLAYLNFIALKGMFLFSIVDIQPVGPVVSILPTYQPLSTQQVPKVMSFKVVACEVDEWQG